MDATANDANAWGAGLKRLLALQAAWEQALQRSGAANLQTARVAQLEEDCLTVYTPSTAARAKLQFLEGELLSYMQSRGWQVNAILYRVQGIDATIANNALAARTSPATSWPAALCPPRQKISANDPPDSFKAALAGLQQQAALARVADVARLAKNRKK